MNSFHAQKSAFGQRLLTARLNANLSQEKLAEAIGASVRSVQRWERGQAVPQGTSRESLCQVLHLSQEALFGKAGDEDGTAWASKTWCIPHQRNRFFTGREDLLGHIHQILSEQNAAALTRSCALSGLGGIGKTQVAIEYAYRYTHAYRTVFWLAADSAESVMGSLYQIAEQLELPARQATEQSHMAAAVQRWLAMHSGWLLIGDNVDDLALLRSVVPSVQQGALLLTTRHQALGTFADSLEVPPMSNEEGATLLLRRAKQMNDFPPGVMLSYQEILLAHPAAEELVNLLNGMPLALDQAGAYIEETGCSVREYLHLCRQQRKHILAHRGAHEGAHPSSVATTLGLSVAQIERVSPAAADLLRLCAFLHPEAIPEELLVVGAPYLGPVLGPVLVDPYQFNLALAALRHASLVTRHPVTRTLSVHRLVQAVLQDQMEPAEMQLWGERVAHMLHAAFPGGDFSTWTQCERLLPHVLMCASTIPEQVFEQELVELFHKAGDYLTWRGQYAQAEALFRQALHMQEQSPGSDHPQIATSLFHLAFLSREQGKYDQAETLFHQALTMHERALGPGHPEVARSLTGLANLYTNLGKYEQAQPLYERALHIWEQIPGSKSPEMGWSLNG
ncbi:MAG TPA: FxSxx-COOH system tetratricopeptide repeat protein, partial [Ktedonobacteraceae bacterium]|nr:FxSxx-COOH system tetratricopeptide repeat protein [Ktedonobacteraceae bacterium]